MDVMPETLTAVRSRIEALGMDFRFKGMSRTGINGLERETWLLDYQGAPIAPGWRLGGTTAG